MKRLLCVVLSFFACGLVFLGCKTAPREANVYAVVIGMENSRFAGACPGAGYDADRMYKLLSKYAPNIVLLRNGNATKEKVVNAINRAVAGAKDGLVIVYYSGHGGSEPFPDTGIEEDDGNDEFLCLWDTWLRDNEIWALISNSKGRVIWITDSCHSQTQFRNPVIRLAPPLSWDHALDERHDFSMLCWSGCPDNTYSYGASSGGQFTNALLRHFNDSKTYEELWEEIKNDKVLRRYENPQSTAIGSGFNGREIFR